MDWKPISLDGLKALMDRSVSSLSDTDRALWQRVPIEPSKWSCSPDGDLGGGFWVVAVLGEYSVWYNDIEDGFNVSRFSRVGTLDAYGCNQDGLRVALRDLVLACEVGGSQMQRNGAQ